MNWLHLCMEAKSNQECRFSLTGPLLSKQHLSSCYQQCHRSFPYLFIQNMIHVVNLVTDDIINNDLNNVDNHHHDHRTIERRLPLLGIPVEI